MEKVSFILPKLAIMALLIGTIVPMNVVSTDDGCQPIHQICAIGLDCCRGLYCDIPPGSPKGTPGICKAKCAKIGKMCSASIGISCCEGLTCYYPPQRFVTQGMCVGL